MHSSRMRTACSTSCLGGEVPASVHAGILPGVGLETPLGVGLETPQGWAWKPSLPGVGLETPQARPLNFPLETCKAW